MGLDRAEHSAGSEEGCGPRGRSVASHCLLPLVSFSLGPIILSWSLGCPRKGWAGLALEVGLAGQEDSSIPPHSCSGPPGSFQVTIWVSHSGTQCPGRVEEALRAGGKGALPCPAGRLLTSLPHLTPASGLLGTAAWRLRARRRDGSKLPAARDRGVMSGLSLSHQARPPTGTTLQVRLRSQLSCPACFLKVLAVTR